MLSRILLPFPTYGGCHQSAERQIYRGGMMKMRSVFGILLLLVASGAALGQSSDFSSVPEPGILELLSIGAVAAVVVALRKRRK
jgi:hypothetical protein